MTQNSEIISLFGEKVKLEALDKGRLKGVFAGAIVAFDFYEAEFQGHSFVVLKSKDQKRLPPSHLSFFAQRLGEKLCMPIVFLLDGLKTIERDRLVRKGIYFVVSGKYAFLPSLIANRRSSNANTATSLTPGAQYLLLYHLQVKSLDNLSAKDLVPLLPYSYISITRAIKVLVDCGLVTVVIDGRSRRIKFIGEGKALWDKCLPLLKSPVKKVRYMDGAIVGDFKICGINALAQYTSLNPDNQLMYALTESEFAEFKDIPKFDQEGDIRLEVWTYPPIPVNEQAVDPLSLCLTLRDDHDPRVEKEVEFLLNEIW